MGKIKIVVRILKKEKREKSHDRIPTVNNSMVGIFLRKNERGNVLG